MAEVLLAYEAPVTDNSGSYRPRAVGREADDGMWEGWLEFEPLSVESETYVGPVESRQPEREHLVYWATGLTPIYLEGALRRARKPMVTRIRVVRDEAPPVSDAPSPRSVTVHVHNHRRDAVLDPFDVASHSGFDVLSQELRAFNRPRLVNIIGEFELNPGGQDLSWMSDPQLVRFIVVAVEAQLLNRAR